MSIDPVEIEKRIKFDFRRYLNTALGISLRYAGLRGQFESFLWHDDALLFRGPYLQGVPPYELDASLRQLADEGTLPRKIIDIPLLDSVDRPLYWHQAEAIRRIRRGHNVVVASGTGSGKTLAFLTPILSEILENPAPGIHAMLLYPMNALVNDQLKALRNVLRKFPQIRFGRYVNIEITPEKEAQGRLLYPEAPPNEVVSREVFRESPPHILITNYAMLEYLLLRPDDSLLFYGPWRYIVLDETHTYSGAKGSETALLMRRLRNRVKAASEEPIQYIATSATLGTSQNPQMREAVVRFVSDLFDASFSTDDIIEARRQSSAPKGGYDIDQALYNHPILTKSCDELKWSEGLSQVLVDHGFSSQLVEEAEALAATDYEAALYLLFRHDQRVEALRQAVQSCSELRAVARKVLSDDDETGIRTLTGLVRICNLARSGSQDIRLVPCRYHFFVRGLEGAHVAFDQQDRAGSAQPSLYLTPIRTTEAGFQTLELHVCRKCGHPHLRGYAFQQQNSWVLCGFGAPEERRGEAWWLTWQPEETKSLQPLSIDEEDEVESPDPNAERRLYCAKCGALREQGDCDCGMGSPFSAVPLWILSEGDPPSRCFACGGANSITPLRSNAEAAQTVITESFYRCLPPSSDRKALVYPGKGRKLLAFSDSRQGAAYFAPYLESRHTDQKLRWLILRAAKEGASEHSISGETLLQYMLRISQDEQLFSFDFDEDAIRRESVIALAKEFCLPIGRRQSLEALGLLAVDVDLGPFYALPQGFQRWGLTEKEQADVIRYFLHTLRIQKIIEIPQPVTDRDSAFKPFDRTYLAVAQDSESGYLYGLRGFIPRSPIARQRRSAYLRRVLVESANRRGAALATDEEVRQLLYQIWCSLIETDGPVRPLAQKSVSGKTGFQIPWRMLRFDPEANWFWCPSCNQFTATNVLGICPSFGCRGRLQPVQPEKVLKNHHYAKLYTISIYVPLVAKEHTAQLSPRLATEYQKAFQEGHSADYGQINVLSCSTTFELGVDLGELEAVVLRNVPPTPANYQQRAGRAGRSAGKAAFVVTFTLPRSHDAHYFTCPEEMIEGAVKPPRISLTNEIIIQRHLNSVLLSDFMRRLDQRIAAICDFFESDHLQTFLDQLGSQVDRLQRELRTLLPEGWTDYLFDLPAKVRRSMQEAFEYYQAEKEMYESAIREAVRRRRSMEAERERTLKISKYIDYLQRRLRDVENTPWINFLSDRNVLPSYAFPIHNVSLETSDSDLRLERDLRIALSEYVPGASIVAKGKLWESIGIRLAPRRTLPRMYYARCPRCWHVQRHLKKTELFRGRLCPVCGHNGRTPVRRKHAYVVPKYGFTTDIMSDGKRIDFDRPIRIGASRVLFVPQQEGEDQVGLVWPEQASRRVEIRTSDHADFFVFNNNRGPGFRICQSCGRAIPHGDSTEHRTPYGRECRGRLESVHLGHDFRGSAARLLFVGTGYDYTAHEFWLSLMYALLEGMADGLGIERQDLDGVIRPVSAEGATLQEIVLFDNVPGGAGHVKRLEDLEELQTVLTSAHARVASCTCGRDASCYRCLRSYNNQFCHDLLQRGSVEDYLEALLRTVQ